MQLPLSNKQRVLSTLINNQGKVYDRVSLSKASGVPVKLVSNLIYVLFKDEVAGLHKVGWGKWKYSPDEEVEEYTPLVIRLHEFITESGSKGVSIQEIAKELDVSESYVPEVMGRMCNRLNVKPNRTIMYSFKEKDDG